MKVKTDKFKMVEMAKKGKAEILFWRSEYCKRKAMIDDSDKYKRLEDASSLVKDELLSVFLQAEFSAEDVDRNVLNWVQISMWREHFHDNHSELLVNDINIRPFLLWSVRSRAYKDASLLFYEFSTEYGYFVHDLLCRGDMYALLDIINENGDLPAPPVFHSNWGYRPILPEEVLTTVRSKDGVAESLPDDLWEQIRRNLPDCHPQGRFATLGRITRQPDFIVMAQALSERFNFDVAFKEIKYDMALHIYDYKIKNGIELTPGEIEAIVEAFESSADNGRYGPSYSQARATGLWLWDYLNENPEVKILTKAYNYLRATKRIPFYEASTDKTIGRVLAATWDSVRAGEVLPIKKCDTRKRKKVS